ncbi:hypothetical protein GIB67_013413 [Kingdonia uniflora]|uniref:Pectinesterase n=1 Tax=Kingdonia uniflora TaxID=39325 RepID=A0A7J7LR93_9MAGN|nr:hypothetical protein GIB67_013413 [Kingdonia uniflora]
MSKCSIISVLLASLIVLSSRHLCSCDDKNDGSEARKYISWKDMDVDWRYDEKHGGVLKNGRSDQVIVVDKNGHGNTTTVQGAVNLVPEGNNKRIKIFINAGTYRERVLVPENKPYISFIGAPRSDTIITYNVKASDKDGKGQEIGTYYTATVDIKSDYFCAKGIIIQNTIVANGGYGQQAVALKLTGDKAVLYKVWITGSQDTLLDLKGSHYFYKCTIVGAIDFIFGNAKSLYEKCVVRSNAGVRKGAIAAHRRNDMVKDDTGFVFNNCVVTGTGKIFLGRAWGPYATILYSRCKFDDVINDARWSDMGHPSYTKTVTFGEHSSQGQGGHSDGRVEWSKIMSTDEIQSFWNISYIGGDQWLRL